MGSGGILTLSAYHYLLGTTRYLGPDDVLQELGYKRNVALTVPGFEQSLFMAAQPQHTMLATAPRYCQHYNQQHQLPLVSRPLPRRRSIWKSCAFLHPAMA